MLLCSDGSPQAEAAVEFGGLLASGETALVGLGEALETSLARSQARLAEKGVEARLLPGPASLVSLSDEYDLLVIGGLRQARPAKVYPLIREASSAVLLVGEARAQLKKILVCTAGGYKGRRAVRFTAAIAKATGASVTLFHVMAEPPRIFEDMEDEEDIEWLMRSKSGLARSLERQLKILAAVGVPHQLRLRYGLVLEEIADEIETGDFDLIVTGTPPTGDFLAGWMMGDMTRSLVEQVDRPILIVRTAGRAENWLGKLARKVLPAGWLRRQ